MYIHIYIYIYIYVPLLCIPVDHISAGAWELLRPRLRHGRPAVPMI